MGQYEMKNGGGKIYLVEDEEMLKLWWLSILKSCICDQTTLSIDDTAKVIDALRTKFPKIQGTT